MFDKFPEFYNPNNGEQIVPFRLSWLVQKGKNRSISRFYEILKAELDVENSPELLQILDQLSLPVIVVERLVDLNNAVAREIELRESVRAILIFAHDIPREDRIKMEKTLEGNPETTMPYMTLMEYQILVEQYLRNQMVELMKNRKNTPPEEQ